MHELSVTRQVLQITLDHAQRSEARRVTRITLVIGQLSCLLDDSIRFYWPIIAEGSIAQQAELVFKRLPARMLCRACGLEYDLTPDFACPACQSSEVQVVAGDDFYIESIQVED